VATAHGIEEHDPILPHPTCRRQQRVPVSRAVGDGGAFGDSAAFRDGAAFEDNTGFGDADPLSLACLP